MSFWDIQRGAVRAAPAKSEAMEAKVRFRFIMECLCVMMFSLGAIIGIGMGL